MVEGNEDSQDTWPSSVAAERSTGFCPPPGRSQVALGTGATAKVDCLQRTRRHNSSKHQRGFAPAVPFSAPAPSKFENGQVGEVRHAADVPAPLPFGRGGIPTPQGERDSGTLGEELDIPRKSLRAAKLVARPAPHAANLVARSWIYAANVAKFQWRSKRAPTAPPSPECRMNEPSMHGGIRGETYAS